MPTDAWLVVPLFNEGPVVGDVIREALGTFPKIVCVDDGSGDDSAGIARRAGAVVVSHPINLGQGAALQTGLTYALQDRAANYFVTFDSDGQHRVSDAEAMVERLRAEPDLDIILGSRFLDDKVEAGALKRLVLKTAVRFERFSTKLDVTDTHNGLRALNRHAASTIRIHQNRMAHGSEFLREIATHKLAYREHPVHVLYTDYSRAKGQSLWNSVNILFDLMFG
ncbi:glycosyltransferase family 2 protein [Propionibacterium australiense]|uniref:Glycosyltransferase n=1 Tax=Propionibacterium australiense TaxID=119981 RepID=A0A8B3FNT4_9ACTN|nr:glycosyltransferase family 2 protein [Propionibacterium australiense]RLP08556.1 glycosyltransferase [Propionibacterium australiense]RLP08623.1 glycosyltransferase [Propionibacterium australiense]